MEDDLFIDPELLQHLDPDFFTASGRALYVAQHFEKNLKSIVAALDLRAACHSGELSYADEDELEDFYIKKLKRSLNTSINKGLPEHAPEFLAEDFITYLLPPIDDAREARNRIAHEFLFGIEHTEIHSHGFKNMVESLHNDVRLIAEADFSVCSIMSGFNRDQLSLDRRRYVEQVVKWVMAPLQEDGQVR